MLYTGSTFRHYAGIGSLIITIYSGMQPTMLTHPILTWATMCSSFYSRPKNTPTMYTSFDHSANFLVTVIYSCVSAHNES